MIDNEPFSDHSSKELILKDNKGEEIITIKLIGNRSLIFINGKEVMACHFVPLPIPVEELPTYDNIESINDVIDHFDRSLEGRGIDDELVLNKLGLSREKAAELDFFVNCSNLQAWVEHDFDTRLLDYRLSFVLLKVLAEAGHERAQVRFKEEIVKRYFYGSEEVKKYLEEDEFLYELTWEEYYSGLIPKEYDAILLFLDLFPLNVYGKNHDPSPLDAIGLVPLTYGNPSIETKIEKIDNKAVVTKLEITKPELNEDAPLVPKLPKEILKFTYLEILDLYSLDLKEIPAWLNQLKKLSSLRLRGLELESIFEGLEEFPSLETLKISSCTIQKLSRDIGNLKNLKELKIHDCSLNSLPETIGDLKNLGNLDLSDNQLVTIPASLLSLEKLKAIDLRGNPLNQKVFEIVNQLSEKKIEVLK